MYSRAPADRCSPRSTRPDRRRSGRHGARRGMRACPGHVAAQSTRHTQTANGTHPATRGPPASCRGVDRTLHKVKDTITRLLAVYICTYAFFNRWRAPSEDPGMRPITLGPPSGTPLKCNNGIQAYQPWHQQDTVFLVREARPPHPRPSLRLVTPVEARCPPRRPNAPAALLETHSDAMLLWALMGSDGL